MVFSFDVLLSRLQESKGRRFESCRGHHCNVDTAIICGVFYFLGNKCQFDTGNIWGRIL